jgi:hypothetical protein
MGAGLEHFAHAAQNASHAQGENDRDKDGQIFKCARQLEMLPRHESTLRVTFLSPLSPDIAALSAAAREQQFCF